MQSIKADGDISLFSDNWLLMNEDCRFGLWFERRHLHKAFYRGFMNKWENQINVNIDPSPDSVES